MTRKLYRIAALFFMLVSAGVFLNSCSDMNLMNPEEYTPSGFADVSFSISEDSQERTALPNTDEHNLKKYLYLYNYTLTYADENEDDAGTEKIICHDFSYDKFLNESNVRLATGKKYKFSLTAKDGATPRMEGSTIITLSEKPSQTVKIVLVPAGDEYGQKLRIDFIVPDDGVITKMKAGISPERGHAEFMTEDEILVPKYRFQEFVFSVIANPFQDDDPRKAEYGNTIKRIGLTYDDVKTNVPRWLDYKFYDANGILVYESSESVYMLGAKTSSTVIYISSDHYYRRPVTIPVYKDGVLWANNPDLVIKLKDKNGHEYILKAVLDEHGKTTGEYEGLLPGASSGIGSSQTTDGIFEIFAGMEGSGFIKTGAEYDANTGTIKGNGGIGIGSGSANTVELVTVSVPQKGVKLTPTDGVLITQGTVGDGSGNGSLLVPAAQDFTVQVDFETGYGPASGGTINVGGKPVSNGEKITLNTKTDNLSDGIKIEGLKTLVYGIVYKSQGQLIHWTNSYTPERTFTIESEDITLPPKAEVSSVLTIDGKKCDGWWFGNGTSEDNLDNIIHKLNKERTVREKIISYAVSKEQAYSGLDSSKAASADLFVVLNVYWIPSNYVEYRIVFNFEDIGPNETLVDKDGNKVVSFHNVALEENKAVTIPNERIKIPEIPGFTHPASVTINVGTEDGTQAINYTRKDISITLDGNGGNWTDGKSTDVKILNGKYGAPHEHVNDPIKEDYKFLGWYVKGDTTQTPIKHVDDHKFPADSVEYAAKWEQVFASYTVEFWYETTDSTAENPQYEKTSSYTVKGEVGSFPAFNTTPKEKGFTFNDKKRSITAGEGGENVNVVKADGSTLAKLYFDRKTVSFTLKANNGKFTDGKGNSTDEIFLEGKFGAALPSVDKNGFRVQVPEPPVIEGINDGTCAETDFTFKAWHVRTETDLEASLPATFLNDDAIYAARWNQNNGIYKVVHWAESMDHYGNGEYKLLAPKAIDGFSGQMLEGSVTKKGRIGSAMVYYHEPVTGFTTPTVEIRNSTGGITGNAGAGNITADDKTEVIVTYLRKDYTISFHLNAGGDTNAKWTGVDAASGSSETVTRTGKYRTDFDAPGEPVREHFIFRGWTTKVDGTLNDRVDVVPSYKEDVPVHYYAVWYSKTSGGLTADRSDISLACSVSGTEIAANVAIPDNSGDWTYTWNINNVPAVDGAGGVTFEENGKVLKLSGCLKKDYEITVVAKCNGKIYTKTEVVTVGK